LYRQIEKLKKAAKRGPLAHWQIKMLKMFAKQGFSGAKEILGTCRQMTPQEEQPSLPRRWPKPSSASSEMERAVSCAGRTLKD